MRLPVYTLLFTHFLFTGKNKTPVGESSRNLLNTPSEVFFAIQLSLVTSFPTHAVST